MLLSRIRVVGVGPFGDLSIEVRSGSGNSAKRTSIVIGTGGVGKSTLLHAIASTRPGYAVAQQRRASASAANSEAPPSFVVTDWALGDDDESRPHLLRVTTPSAVLEEREDAAILRRREQSFFERRAGEGGFAFIAFSGARWFSRAPILLTGPDRSLARYDVRASSSFDDATRADLARDTKQALVHAAIAASLTRDSETPSGAARLDAPMRATLAPLLDAAGFAYVGVDPASLEPTFTAARGARVAFDDLPNHVRHLIAFGALTLRTLYAAYPYEPESPIDLRAAEGVALIDDVDLHQPESIARTIAPLLAEALPRVQWIVTTSSPGVAIGSEATDVIALRRASDSDVIEAHEGDLAITH